jgi:DNA-binding winged helix-turn-helix (wHTH) protein/quercetin dioxygenase-like cupin family protein
MGNGTAAAYRFGEFVLNLERGCLQRDGADLELRPKAFDVLRYLVESAGKLASKDELVQVAWPNVAVSDDSLAQCVSDIRKLLDDDEQRFIKTVPRKGYVFVAGVDAIDGKDGGASIKEAGEPVGRRRLLAMPRWDFGSFAVGFMLPILLAAVWMGAAKALVGSTEAPSPPYPLFQGNKTVLGQTIAYPIGTPLLKAAILRSKPGEEFDWHTHEIPAFGYILEGEITVDYGSKGIRVFRAGDAMLEALDWPHRPSNRGTTPARVFALYIGAEGTAFANPVVGPK